MQVLKIISDIWKSGAEIYRDDSDGRLALKNAKLVPADVLKAADPIFNQIEEWFKSWEGAKAIDVTIKKILHHNCGWQTNEKLNDWICSDEKSLQLWMAWQEVLAKNGWKDIYDDYRQFENKESNELKQKIYERAILYANQNK